MVSAAIALTGCAGSSAGAATSGHDMSSMPGTSGEASPSSGSGTSAHNKADVTFATDMIPHHAKAVTMADMALKSASSPAVKALAQQIKDAQGPEIATMTSWLKSWQEPVPDTSMDPGMAGMDHGSGDMPGMMSGAEMNQLGQASGAQFDTMWTSMMIKHHEGAVTMAGTEITDGQDGDAKALAQQIVDAQRREIATMQQLLPSPNPAGPTDAG